MTFVNSCNLLLDKNELVMICQDCKLKLCICNAKLAACGIVPHRCTIMECKTFPTYFHKNGCLCKDHYNFLNLNKEYESVPIYEQNSIV